MPIWSPYHDFSYSEFEVITFLVLLLFITSLPLIILVSLVSYT
jgi:hypothetical protein